ncbi:MAG: NYN domain-containing protein [Candidatus Thorarchaeota archaeon]
MGKAAVLIDNGYFSKVLKYCFGEPRIDYGLLSDRLCSGWERFRTYFYDCMPYRDDPPTDEQSRRFGDHDRFIHTLKRLDRFEVRLGKLARNPSTGEYEQKRVDVLISVDLVRMSCAKWVDAVILVSGDSDLVPAVEAAKHEGVVTVLYYKNCDYQGQSKTKAHDELIEVCDERHEIDRELINSVSITRAARRV